MRYSWFAAGSMMLVLSLSPAQAQPPGGGGFPGGGGGGGGRGNRDPNQMFDRLANGKEFITRQDITNPFMQGMFDRMVESLGVTNGQVTREQFTNYMTQMRGQFGGRGGRGGGGPGGGGGQPGGGGGDPNQRMNNWAERMFQNLDQNGDGLLNNDEMPEELRAERDRWDTNRDGFIDLTEFKAYFTARLQQRFNEAGAQGGSGQGGDGPVVIVTPAVPEEEKRPVVFRAGKLPKELPSWFASMDTDGDGQIGLYEWKASGRPLDEFQRMDRNGDGFLTAEEVLYYTANTKGTGAAMASGPGGANVARFSNGGDGQSNGNGQFNGGGRRGGRGGNGQDGGRRQRWSGGGGQGP